MTRYDKPYATLVPVVANGQTTAIEVWCQGIRLATITGGAGPYIHITSPHELWPLVTSDGAGYAAEVRVKVGTSGDVDRLLRLEGRRAHGLP